MAVHLRPKIMDPMLVGFHEQKEAAFLQTVRHLKDAQLRLIELDEEIKTFKERVVAVVEEYQHAAEPSQSLTELKKEKGMFLEQYQEFKEIYVKASAVAYRTLETINLLQPAFRSASEEKYFEENAPDFYAQMGESDKVCSRRAKTLQGMFTDIVHQKSVTLALIEDISLAGALKKLHTIVENRNVRHSRTSQLFNYISSYALPPVIREPSPEPKKIISPKRAALTPLNIAAIPPFNPSEITSLHARVSPSPSHRFPLLSNSGSLGFSSGTTTSSPRVDPYFPSKTAKARNAGNDSWASISLGASSARESLGGPSRESRPMRRDLRVAPRDSTSPRGISSVYSPRDRGMSSPREAFLTRSRRDREPTSPREISPAHYRRDRDLRFSIRDRETYSRRDRELTSSSQEQSPRQTGWSLPKIVPRETSYKPAYRPSTDRKFLEPDSSIADQERRKRHSLRPSIQYKSEEKKYPRDPKLG